jgi:hypothetical protein
MPDQEIMGGWASTGLDLLLAELSITLAHGPVWGWILISLLVGAACLGLGMWMCRVVGLVDVDAPVGEVLGVGLGVGLVVLSTWWAALWSGGRSAFTPVAVSFVVAILAGWVGPRLVPAGTSLGPYLVAVADGHPRTRRPSSRRMVVPLIIGAATVAAVAIVYGATMAPSPRDGMQPIEFADVAFYSVLGRDLATSATESNLGPSGFTGLPVASEQIWYHWSEIWLAAMATVLLDVPPIPARYFVILPLILAAAAAVTGTVVRRFAATERRTAFWFGFASCLVLAPISIPATFFSAWPSGLAFGVTLYGTSAVAILLAFYCIAVVGQRPPTWSLIAMVASLGAFVLPSHPVLAALAVVGFAGAWAVRSALALAGKVSWTSIPFVWVGIVSVGATLVVVTWIWGAATGHGLGGSESLGTIRPFSSQWLISLAATYVGAGLLLTVPMVAVLDRKRHSTVPWLGLGVAILVVFGAVAWGARLDDFNMFHLFYGGLAVFAVPVATVTTWLLMRRARASRHRALAGIFVALVVLQLGFNAVATTIRLQEFGPRRHNEPVAVSLLEAMRTLPPDAKIAYACRPFEEFSFADSSLLSLDAHTARRIIPMCFQADVFSHLNGARKDPSVPAAGFQIAPQSALYPTPDAAPTPDELLAFLASHGVRYLYADQQHPPLQVPGAEPILSAGQGMILQIP